MNKQLEKAIKAHKQGLHQQAEKAYLVVLKKTPLHPEACYLLGTLYGQTGRFSQAIDYLKKSIELAPQRIPAHMNLAQALFDSKHYEEATYAYTKALKYNSNSFQALYGLGCALQAKGDFKKAIDSYHGALSINQNHIPSCLNLGICLSKCGDDDKAISIYRKLLEVDPSSGDAFRCLGHSLYKKGQIEEAQQSFEDAIKLNSVTTDAFLGLGDTFLEQKKFHRALKPFQQAIDLNPSSQDAHIKLETALLWDSSEKNQALLKTLWEDLFFEDPKSAIDFCKRLAKHFTYEDRQATEALDHFLNEFDPSKDYNHKWWNGKLEAFGSARASNDKLLRAIFTSVYSWSIPNREALETIADFVGTRRLHSYGAGAGYWEFLLSSNFNLNVAASDIAVRHRFFDVKADNYGSAGVNPSDVIFIAWILGNDADVQHILENMQSGQHLVLIGEPPDHLGIPRICASKPFFAYLEQNFNSLRKQDLAQFSYLNDTLEIFEKR